MAEYRVKEKVGTGQFMIQKKFRAQKKIENPNWFDRLYFWWTGKENKDSFIWRSLTCDNTFSNSYYTEYYKYFDTLEQANKAAKELKENQGETKYHKIE